MLVIEDLHKSYATAEGPVPVLRGVSLTLAAGASLALMGDSGSGKSTLIHLAAGLDRPDRGRVLIGDAEMTARDDAGRAALRRSRIGLIFQQFNLIPSLSVADNIAFQARIAGREDPALLTGLVRRLGLGDQLARFPEDLSGGQQQRVAIARALAARPALVLADEPTGNLDEATADRVMDLLVDTVAEAGAALLMVTHSARHAARLGGRMRLETGRIAA